MLVSLSTLLRGTVHEKLQWTFTLYDLNKDGYITKQEVLNVMVAVHELMGVHASPLVRFISKIPTYIPIITIHFLNKSGI